MAADLPAHQPANGSPETRTAGGGETTFGDRIRNLPPGKWPRVLVPDWGSFGLGISSSLVVWGPPQAGPTLRVFCGCLWVLLLVGWLGWHLHQRFRGERRETTNG